MIEIISSADKSWQTYQEYKSWQNLYKWFCDELQLNSRALRDYGHHDKDILIGHEAQVMNLATSLRTERLGPAGVVKLLIVPVAA